ncbi:hypothetical protein AB0J83_37005 [Actinoplanes sp. NPDC049596]|uniref:hypothetical protein n=1 Tax=unclassified Actinoplanes TaxID=2626549 RepID=UPI003415802A
MTRRLLRDSRILSGLLAMTLVLSGCALLGRQAVRVVMKIAGEVVVTAGSEFVHQMIGGDADSDRPTVTIDYQDSSQRRVAVSYSVDDAKAISVSGVEGKVEVTGDGERTTVRVQPPSTATIEILGTDKTGSTPAVAVPQAVEDLTEAAEVLSGTWQGTYRCAQGLTGLRLVLYPTGDGTLLGTFNFYAVQSNSGVPSGRYAMRGTYSDVWFDLKSDYWIDQPAGYGMVDVSGDVPRGASGHLTGRLPGSCKTYDLAKVSEKTSKPPV